MTATATATNPVSGDPSDRAESIRKRIRNAWMLRSFMLAKLPLGLIAGLKVTELDEERCEVFVPYGWRTTNPFRSMYFAAQSMAAEMSTGALGLTAVRSAPVPVSVLIVGMEAEFCKKANQHVRFRCADGAVLADAVQRAVDTGESVTAEATSVGTMPDGTVVSRFRFTWSFRRKSQ